MIYLDNAATTQPKLEVFTAMMPYMTDKFGNPGTIYSIGREANRAVSEAREKVANFFGCTFEEVVFTSGGSEGNNFVIKGLKNYMKSNHIPNYLSSVVEHDSVLAALRSVCESNPAEFNVIKVSPDITGSHDIKEIEDIINIGKIGLASFMLVNNETGAINYDIPEISRMIHKNHGLMHSDCVQAAGALPLNMNELGVDFATISGHKINGPKGIGAIFIRSGFPELSIDSIIDGGKNQEFGKRGGTENVPGIVGLGVACEIAMNNLHNGKVKTELLNKKKCLRDEMIELSKKNGIHIVFNADMASSINKIQSVTIPDVDAQTLVAFLDKQYGVMVSAGSACSSQSLNPSHVLTGMGISDKDAACSIRISMSDENSFDDIKYAAQSIIEAARLIKRK